MNGKTGKFPLAQQRLHVRQLQISKKLIFQRINIHHNYLNYPPIIYY